MRRRDLIGIGLGGYSLAVLAHKLPAAQLAGAASAEDIREQFDRIVPEKALEHTLAAEPNMTLVELEADFCVAGGGLAGVCAAISAARHGAKVVLIQDRSRLGGNSSSEVHMHVVGANCHKGRPGGGAKAACWRSFGWTTRSTTRSAPSRCGTCCSTTRSSANRTSRCCWRRRCSPRRRDGNRITEVLARCDRSEHLYQVKAKLFSDCTGDSRLAVECGADYRTGREGKAELGESLAPEKADNETLGSSILFTARDYGRPVPFTPPKWARKVTAETLRMRKIRSWEYGYWWIEWGGEKDIVRDNERIRFELLSITMGVWDYIKNSGDHPSSANWGLDWVGMMPGRRGSRRMEGDVLLTQQDLERGLWEDSVAIGGWAMDDHPPGGFDREDLPPNTAIKTDEVYNIPLRALYSRNVDNLFMAGRNISATHTAFTSTRVMGTCAVVGQAVGAAAAQCVRDGLTPRRLYEKKTALSELQQTLLRDDQTIRDGVNQDPQDLARKAKVTASGYSRDAKPELVLDGVVRDIPRGTRQEIHRWTERLGPEGAWIELEWDSPQAISEVQITFDTGFQRELTLSSSARVQENLIRGPQPETVRDYKLSYRSADGAEPKQIAAVQANHQRLRRHKFESVKAKAVRVHVTSANRGAQARIFEIRCYA